MTNPAQVLKESSMRAYYVQNLNHVEDFESRNSELENIDSKFFNRELINTVFYWLALLISLWGAIYLLVFLMSSIFDTTNTYSTKSLELFLRAAFMNSSMNEGGIKTDSYYLFN